MNSSNGQDDDGDDVLATALALGGLGVRINWGIDWRKLGARLADSPPAITERTRCDLLIKAVNGEPLSHLEWIQFLGAAIARSPADARALALPSAERLNLSSVLERLIDDQKVNVSHLGRVAQGNVVVIPDFKSGGERVVAASLAAAIYYALRLLADPARPFRELLCRCGFSGCKRFYFLDAERRAGAPNRVYCIPEHRVEGNKEKSADYGRKARRKAK